MNSHEGGDAAQRLRCTHLSFDYARGKYPERVQEDHTISVRCWRMGDYSLRSCDRVIVRCAHGGWVTGSFFLPPCHLSPMTHHPSPDSSGTPTPSVRLH